MTHSSLIQGSRHPSKSLFQLFTRWSAPLVAIASLTITSCGSTTTSADESSPTGDTVGIESESSTEAGASSASDPTIGKGLGSKDASGDIDSINCKPPDAIGAVYVDVKITNRSSKPSDYFITIVAESEDGSVRYDDTIVSAMALNPGQTTTVEGIFLNELGEDAVCKVTEVQRTAS